jgi:hypothetical protein
MLIKQPNGKYCIAYSFDNQPITINLTEQDIIDKYINEANEAIKNALHFGKLIETRKVSDEELREMGSDKTYAELIKYVPLEPKNTRYASCDFATYGECPSCGDRVQDGIGLTHEKCSKCGQLLKWR